MAENKQTGDPETLRTDHETGQQEPRGSGFVSDEDIQDITEDNADAPIGQDHSLDNYGDSEPTEGVGAVQNHSVTTSDIARIDD
jgi:hypothetical protein